MHVLLTGGSGFIAHHVLNTLLAHGHSVITTVRSEEKAQKVRSATDAPPSKLGFAIVPDIAVEDAFDDVIQSANPPFDAVIHTASPFRFDITDVKKELLDPAIIGTTGILKSIKRFGPTVKHVVITSSFAAVIDSNKGLAPGYVYSENDWNPITEDEAMANASGGYKGSKTFAERAAWEFVEKEKPGFTLTTMNPPLVLGPIEPKLQGLESLNTSNQRIRNIVQGKAKEEIPETGTFLWVDVRVSVVWCGREVTEC
jgi:nucleoside-diphosphate-sugar epimerase